MVSQNGQDGTAQISPHKFAEDYLHLDLHLFQKVLLVMMNWSISTVFIGCRGIGKSFLSAVFCVIRCILYPGTKIVIASGTRGQSINVLEKILLELKPLSPELASEINDKETQINGTKAIIVFKNTSYIKVVTAGESARSNRATLLLIDEFRLVPYYIIDDILKKFLTQRRRPRYSELPKSERKKAWAREHNKIMFLSSAYFTDHWSYRKCIDTANMMLNPNKRHFICGLPYQLSLLEGLIDKELIEDEMAETNYSEVKFRMEYEALWYGSAEGTFFDFDSISSTRRLKYPMLPSDVVRKLNNSPEVRIPPKRPGEVRILSADIAVMSSKKRDNDASAIYINQMLPTKSGRYTSNFVFTDAWEGMLTQDQALIIRKWFDEFECDYLVLDAQGVGNGIFDLIIRDMVDPETGEIYPALGCYNNPELSERCLPGAPKVIWAVKASAGFNSDCAYLLREGFKSGKIRLLQSEIDAENDLSAISKYSSLSQEDKTKVQMPYIHTTLAVDELVNLQHEEAGAGKIRIKEKSGRRKDRYSSISYNYYVAIQVENKLTRRRTIEVGSDESFIIKPPSCKGKAVNNFANYHVKRY